MNSRPGLHTHMLESVLYFKEVLLALRAKEAATFHSAMFEFEATRARDKRVTEPPRPVLMSLCPSDPTATLSMGYLLKSVKFCAFSQL